MASSSDGSLARVSHLRLVDPATAGAAARALAAEARALEALGRRSEARALYERALHSLGKVSPALASTILRSIAGSFEADLDYLAAADCAEAAVAAAEQSDDRLEQGKALIALATARWRQGDLAAAELVLHQALERGASAGDEPVRAEVMCMLGALAKVRGDFREALRCYEDALVHARRDAQLDGIVVALDNVGLANLELGRLTAAADALAEALSVANALGGLPSRIRVEISCAALEIERGDLVGAKRHCDSAMTLAAHTDDARANGEAEKVHGVIAREMGDLVAAEGHLARARTIGADTRDLALEGDASRELAVLYQRLGRNRETLQALTRAHACYFQLGTRHELADVGRRMTRLEERFLDVARSWSESIEQRDEFTAGHCERVADLASALAVKMGIEEPSLFWFRIGALLHDVGKLIVPAELLNKAGALSDEERALVRRHAEAGAEMLGDLALPWDVVPMVRSHHERWDGQGYPDRLAGDTIPLTGRILGIADVYDALVSDRSYKRAFTHLEAMEIMRRDVGKQFDPQLFARFEELVRRGTVTMPRTTSTGQPLRRSAHGVATGAAEEDDLTGTLVRRAFTDVTAAVLAERRRTAMPVSMLVVDVDQFKSVNDTHGHLTGDDALRLVAGVIRNQLRPGQYVGRYAGDEFVVLLPGLDVDAARALADVVRRTTASLPIPLRDDEGHSVMVTLSIGVAAAPRHGETFESLFMAGDRALFEAKREGRDKVVVAGASGDGAPQLVFSRFVGRTNELRMFLSVLDECMHGTPQLRVVLGEAGVGKSTLVRQLLPEARLRGVVMATGQAMESGNRPSYGPWADLLRNLHELELVPARRWPLLERMAPALRGNEGARRVLPPVEDSQTHQLADELVAYLRAASTSCPLVIALEDMQWADAASWDTLEYVLAKLGPERITIAVTIRREDALSGAIRERRQRLARDERTRELHLSRLTTSDVRGWLQGALRRSDVGEELVSYIMEHTEGNPFLVLQLLRALADAGAFTHTAGGYSWTLPAGLVLPDAMVDLLACRLAGLSDEVTSVLAAAAAIGRTFSLELLAEAAAAPMDVVLDTVDAGMGASVLEPSAHAERYEFTHALLLDAVLRTVSTARQRVLHERIAAILAARPEQSAAEIAGHYARSGNAERAHAWCRTAASVALAGHELRDATHFLELALVNAGSAVELAAVHEELARVAELTGRWSDVVHWCDESLESHVVAGNDMRALRVRLRRFRAIVRRGANVSDDAGVEPVARELLATAERVGLPQQIIHARLQLVHVLARTGETTTAIQMAAATMRLANQTGDAELVAEAAHRLACTLLATQPEEAIALLIQVVMWAKSVGNRVLEARALLALGVTRTRTRETGAARAALRAAVTVARDAQSLDLAATASMNLGALELRTGNFAAAHGACNDAVLWYAALGNETNRLVALYHMAGLERERGDTNAATRLYGELAASSEESHARRDVMVATQAGLGLTALRMHDVQTAREQRDRALATLGTRDGWWFHGRELLESLVVRLAVLEGAFDEARARFHHAVEQLERADGYAAAWLVADCAGELVTHDRSVWAAVTRFSLLASEREFVPLSARFTALHDLVNRVDPAHRHPTSVRALLALSATALSTTAVSVPESSASEAPMGATEV